MRAIGYISLFTLVCAIAAGLAHTIFRIPPPDPPIAVMEILVAIAIGAGAWHGRRYRAGATAG